MRRCLPSNDGPVKGGITARGMDNEEKCKTVKDWVDPEERITVDFQHEGDLSAEITGCTRELVDLALDTTVPHMRQQVCLPARRGGAGRPNSIHAGPDRPLRRGRLRLVVKGDRPFDPLKEFE